MKAVRTIRLEPERSEEEVREVIELVRKTPVLEMECVPLRPGELPPPGCLVLTDEEGWRSILARRIRGRR